LVTDEFIPTVAAAGYAPQKTAVLCKHLCKIKFCYTNVEILFSDHCNSAWGDVSGTRRGECIIGFFRVIIDFIEEKCKMIGAFRRDNQDFWLNHVFCG
jgi:hypothetical protein